MRPCSLSVCTATPRFLVEFRTGDSYVYCYKHGIRFQRGDRGTRYVSRVTSVR